MSGPQTQGSLTGRDVVVAVVAAAAVLALALTGAGRSRELDLERRASLDEAVVAEVSTGVALDLERAITLVGDAARNVAAPAPVDLTRVSVPGASEVGLVSPDGGRAGSGSVLPEDDPNREVAAVLDRARDTGQTVVSAPLAYGTANRTLVVAAAYSRDSLSGRPVTADARRARLVGWVVAPIDLGELVGSHLPAGAVGAISDGTVEALGGEDEVPRDLPAQVVGVGGRGLIVRAGDPTGVPRGAPEQAFAIVGLGLALLAAVVVLGAARRMRSLQFAAAQRANQVALIGEVAPLVQQSLELAEVLPAVAVQLSDHFGLTGVAMSTGAGSTGGVGLFSLGAVPDPQVKAVRRPPNELKAGETLVLAMQRGGRGVARLALVAGRDLDAPDLQSLRAITELVTAAVVNASLYASQQEALRNLRDLDALKTVFLGTASHELRTPATAISGFAALLESSWDRFGDEQRRDFVHRIGANARSLSAVVQDLLDFSLLDGGAVSLTIESVDLPAVVGSVVERLAPVFTDHEISLSVEPAPRVDGDVNGLERVVTNLLTNASKFSPAGTKVWVAVGPTADGFGAQVAVSDEGPGIRPDERARVFARFYRGGGAEVVQTRGVGIGLSVVAELVARLRGEVILDDAPGGGARFTIRLPASTVPSVPEEISDASTT